MTRSEFIEDITSWGELLEFCSEEECYELDEVFDDNGMDNEINEYLREEAGQYDWYDLRDYLMDIPTGYEYYRENSIFDWDGLTDDDFEDYKNDVLTWADGRGGFEDEEDSDIESDEEVEQVVEEPEDPPAEDEDFSFDELFGMCVTEISEINKRNEQERDLAYAKFEKFVKCG